MSPRTPAQQAAIRAQSRRNLLDTALELFSSRGYHETTMAEVANAASVSKGLIYHYFPGKKELLQALIEEGFQAFSPAEEQLAQCDDERDRLSIILEAFLGISPDTTRFWRLYFSLVMQPGVFEQVLQQFQEYLHLMRALLGQLFRELEYEHPDQEALLFAGALEGILFHYMIDPEGYPLREMRGFLRTHYNLPAQATKRK